MLSAWKGAYARAQTRSNNSDGQLEQYELLKVKFQEQIAMMKTQAKSLQSSLDFQRAKVQEYSNKLTVFELREGDSDYDAKKENRQL